MIIVTILGVILFIGGVVFSAYKINDYCADRYGYAPFNFLTLALAIVPYVLLFLSLFMGNRSRPLVESENFLAALVIFAVANVILLFLLLSRTSIGITTISIPLIHIAGVLLICLFVLTALGESDRRNRYY